MANLSTGYYWIMLLDSGLWQVASYTSEGHFLLCGDPIPRLLEHIGQIGERIPSNYLLVNAKRNTAI